MNDNFILENKEKKRLWRTLITVVAIFVFIYSFILAPLYTYTISDVLFDSTPVPDIIRLLLDVTDVLSYSISFSIIIYSIFKFSFRHSFKLLTIYSGAIFIKYLANFLITSFVNRFFDVSDILYIVLYFIFDIIMLSSICIFSYVFIRRFNERKKIIEKSNRTLGQPQTDMVQDIFSSKKIFVRENPLHCSALATAIILSLAKLISRIYSDIYFGIPSSVAGICWMIAYYLSDILIAIISYAVSLFIFNYLNSKDLKTKKELL